MANKGKSKGKGKALQARQARRAQARAGAPPPSKGKAKVGGLPVLLAPLHTNASRIVTFALPRGVGSVTVVEAYLCMPEGLFRLQASPSSTAAYRDWAKEMCQPGAGEPVGQRVRVPGIFLQRKLWEIGELARLGLVGHEVDKALLGILTKPTSPPPHPTSSLDLSAARILVPAELDVQHLRPFRHDSAEAALREDWSRHGGAPLIGTGGRGDDWLDTAVRDWAAQWGWERVTETLLDAALYHAGRGRTDVARTFQAPTIAPDDLTLRTQVGDFLRAFVLRQFA